MGLTLTIIIICVIYYIVYKYFPDYITWQINYSITGLILLYFVVQYLINFEYPFLHKTMKNIYHSDNQPLYSNNSSNSNSELYNSNSSKNLLLQNQQFRCFKCHNIIDSHNSFMVYTNPLKYGGKHNISNLSLLCNSCYQFHN